MPEIVLANRRGIAIAGPDSGQPFTRGVVDVRTFSALVARGAADDCWRWKGTTSRRGGYGVFPVPKLRKGGVHAHRVAYVLAHGSIPAGMCVMHRCDNPPCVNPAHLQLGTHGDNIRDAFAKGRMNSANARKTRCMHGHEFSADNTIARSTGRTCRTCRAVSRLITSSHTLDAGRDAFLDYVKTHVAPLAPPSLADLRELVDDRRADVFCTAFGLFGFAIETGQSIADRYGITRERARQLRNSVLLRLGASRAVIRNIPRSHGWKEVSVPTALAG
jgi:hypothetical protein